MNSSLRPASIFAPTLLGALLACGGGGGSSSSPSSGSTPPQLGSTTTYVAPDGTSKSVPLNLSHTTIQSWVPSGSGFTQYAGSGSAYGVLNLGSAPAGPKWIEVGFDPTAPDFFWTSVTQLDLGSTVMGRPNAATAMAPTYLTLNLGNMDAWATSDDIELYSPNLGQWHELEDFPAVINAPLAGATTLSGLSLGWTGTYDTRLVDGGKGDQLYIARFASHPVGSGFALGLSQIFQPISFTMQSGATSTLSGNFSTVPQSDSLFFAWDGAAFSSLSSQVAPSAYLWADFSLLDVQPGGTSFGPAYPNPDLFYTKFLGAYAGSVGPFTFGNPYPAAWPRVFSVLVYYRATIVAPGATHASGISLLCSTDRMGVPANGSVVGPTLGPVHSPMINGLDAMSPSSGVGTNPTLTWAQPSLGSATDYMVSVYKLGNNAGYTTSTKVASLYTTNTQMTIPPGILTTGQTYVFVIRATHRPGVDAAQHPFRTTFDQAVCELMTGQVAP